MRNIIKKERTIKQGEKTRVVSKGYEYFIEDDDKDFHTQYGAINKSDLKKGGLIKVAKEEFLVYPGTFADSYKRIQRGPQIIVPKDLGLIIVETGLKPGFKVLEAGVGSGAATAYFSLIADEVISFDISEDSLKISNKNLEKLGVPKEKYSIKKGDIYDPSIVEQKDYFDLFLLDVPQPEKALATAKKVLKLGGYLVLYTPHITQALKTINLLDDSFVVEKTSELIEREWRLRGKMARPESKDFGHTAFLTFIRRVI